MKLEVLIVKAVIKELITFDGVKLQLIETEKLLELSNSKIQIKDSVITNLNSKVNNLNEIIKKKDEQFGLEREKSESLLKELKQEKRKNFFYKIGAIGGIAVGVFFGLSK